MDASSAPPDAAPGLVSSLARFTIARPRTILFAFALLLALSCWRIAKFADTEGLRTFGAAAIAGELACITTAILLMPAVLALLERRAPAATTIGDGTTA